MGDGKKIKKGLKAPYQTTSPPYPTSFEASLNAINATVASEMNDFQTAEFKVKEVQWALNQMHPTKVPGPDGMSPIFYQKYWNIVGSIVIDCVLNTLKSAMMLSGLNDTYIWLVPKVKSPQKITEF